MLKLFSNKSTKQQKRTNVMITVSGAYSERNQSRSVKYCGVPLFPKSKTMGLQNGKNTKMMKSVV